MVDYKVAVVTGATSGIGAAVAERLAGCGYAVALVGRNEEKGNALEGELREKGFEARFFICDVSLDKCVSKFAKLIMETYGRVDVLFNNAGIMLPPKEIERLSEEEWKRTFETNVDSVFYMTKHLKNLILKCKGCIINNASIAGMHSYVVGRSYAYSASKSAVIQFTRQMALNYAEEGIRVNCICPGIIDTPILGERDRNEYAKRVPLGYVGKPEDVANVVAFLASEQASYLTGIVLPIDGGGTFKVDDSNVERLRISPVLKDDVQRIISSDYFEGLKHKKVLITGGNGFFGYYLVNTLMYANDYFDFCCEIILLTRSINSVVKTFGNVLGRKDIKLIIQDIREEIISGVKADLIIHAATTSDNKQLRSNGPEVIDSAINGTKNIIRYAIKSEVESLIYVSSITVYGDCAVNPVTEDCCGTERWDNDISCYTYGKRVSEYLLFEEYKKSGLPVKIIRPGYVYGANKPEDSRVYAEIIKKAANKEPIVLNSSGLVFRPVIYIMDVIDAIFRALLLGYDGQPYNVSGEVISIREFAEQAAQLINSEVEILSKEPERETAITRYSSDKIAKHCGWTIHIRMIEGIKKSIDIYRERWVYRRAESAEKAVIDR